MGSRDKRRRIGFAVCLLIPLSGTAGCVYDYPEPVPTPNPVRTPTAGPSIDSRSPKPYTNLRILEQEAQSL